jgi:DNA polymerase-3 subunit delta
LTVIYLLVDDFAGRAKLAELEAALGETSIAALNTTALDGTRFDLSELMAAAEALPFLAERRLVVVRGLLGRGGDAEGGGRRVAKSEVDERLASYLERVPPTADVVFLEAEAPPKSAVQRAIERLAAQGRAQVVADAPLDERGAVEWVRKRAAALGADMDGAAAIALVEAVGVDRRALDREIEKLALYGLGGRVGIDAVRELVPSASQSDIFALLDAIGQRNAAAAVRAWRGLRRHGENPHRVVPMVARQVRQLIQVTELRSRPQLDLARTLGVPPFVAAKLGRQAANWPPGSLEQVLRRLVELDRESKTGGQDAGAALEALVAELVADVPSLSRGRGGRGLDQHQSRRGVSVDAEARAGAVRPRPSRRGG